MNLLPYITFCVSVTLASWFNPAGWLDRLVQHHKQKFLNEFNEVAPVQIKATVIANEPGYVDSPDWDINSVMRLLYLIRISEHAKPVQLALRRMLRPTRRFMSKAESYKYFPSLAKDHVNDFYYDVSGSGSKESSEEKNETSSTSLDDDAIIIITNPVEARLPSSRITVRLLKEIMEARGNAAREMPTVKPWTPWPKSTTSPPPGKNNEPDPNVPDQVNEANLRKAAEEQGYSRG